MHNLSASFVLGYHGCTLEVGERLLSGEAFLRSENEYDWLGSGIYFWETNPDRALDWSRLSIQRLKLQAFPFVVGAVIDLGFCLDLMSTAGISQVEQAHNDLVELSTELGWELPQNRGGDDLLLRYLDRAVIEFLHTSRDEGAEQAFDTVRGLFPESTPLYENSGFRRKTHIQICVRNHACIKGVFRVPQHHFTAS